MSFREQTRQPTHLRPLVTTVIITDGIHGFMVDTGTKEVLYSIIFGSLQTTFRCKLDQDK